MPSSAGGSGSSGQRPSPQSFTVLGTEVQGVMPREVLHHAGNQRHTWCGGSSLSLRQSDRHVLWVKFHSMGGLLEGEGGWVRKAVELIYYPV